MAHISSYKPDKTAAVSFYVVLWHKKIFFLKFFFFICFQNAKNARTY